MDAKHIVFLGSTGFMVATGSLDWLQTLADSTRVRLLRLLVEHELSVSEMCAVLQLPQSTVSRHLKVLSADGWVTSRRDGTNHLYRLENASWCDSRSDLWQWVAGQAASPSIQQDQDRLRQVLAQRSRSEEFFSSTAEQWDRLRVDLFGKQIDSFALAAALPRDAVVGELGCGSAPICQLIAPFVREAIAVDSSQAMLSAASQRLAVGNGGEERPNIRLVQAELSATTLEANSLDVAWLVLVLPYIDDPIEVLIEARRVLKPNATLVILDLLPHDRATYQQELGHVRLGVEKSQLEAWLSEAGMHVLTHHPIPPDPDVKGPALFAVVAACPS